MVTNSRPSPARSRSNCVAVDNYGLILCESCCRLAYSGEHHGQMLVEFVFDDFENLLFVCVDFVPQRLALVERQFFDFVGIFSIASLSAFVAAAMSARTSVIFWRRASLSSFSMTGNLFLDFGKDGLYGFQVARVDLSPKYSFKNRCE